MSKWVFHSLVWSQRRSSKTLDPDLYSHSPGWNTNRNPVFQVSLQSYSTSVYMSCPSTSFSCTNVFYPDVSRPFHFVCPKLFILSDFFSSENFQVLISLLRITWFSQSVVWDFVGDSHSESVIYHRGWVSTGSICN